MNSSTIGISLSFLYFEKNIGISLRIQNLAFSVVFIWIEDIVLKTTLVLGFDSYVLPSTSKANLIIVKIFTSYTTRMQQNQMEEFVNWDINITILFLKFTKLKNLSTDRDRKVTIFFFFWLQIIGRFSDSFQMA